VETDYFYYFNSGVFVFSFMRNLYLYSLTLAAGLMFTPDMLTLFGNSLGTIGWIFLLMTPVALVVHLATVHSFQLLDSPAGSHLVGFQKYLGRRRAAVIALSGKLPFSVCASAALAVTAGFVFNEVFVYWFPNFAFAFLLLGATAAVNLISRTAAQAIQVIAISTVCIGLIVLCGASLSHLPGEIGTHEFKFDFNYRHLAAAFVVLIGYDLGLYVYGNDRNGSRRSGAMVAAVVGGALILALWGLAAMTVVSPEKLESSTVPYMTAARKALGQPGRYIMGTVAIAAVFGAINSMMHSVSMMASQLASNFINNQSYYNRLLIRPATVLLIAGASASLMALGFAGEPHLETWLRASIILWMIYYMFVNITAIRAMHQSSRPTPPGKVSATMLLKIFSVAGMALAATGMILIEPEPFQLLMFAIIVVAVLAVIVNSVDFFLNRNRSMRPRQ
jgi:amino acid transporter